MSRMMDKKTDVYDILSLGGIAFDPNKSARAVTAAHAGQQKANTQLDADTSQQFGMLSDAMTGRSLGQNLNEYNTSIGAAQGKTSQAGDLAWQQQNAGRSDNVQSYMNPQMEMMLNQTLQKVQGGAGSALQSSAATKAGANAVATKAGDLWQQAFNNAMGDAQNNLNVSTNYGQSAAQNANLAGQTLAANNQPAEDYLSLKNDIAMQRYAGNIGLTQMDAMNAAKDQSLLGAILG